MLGEDALDLLPFVEKQLCYAGGHAAFLANPAEHAGEVGERCLLGRGVQPALVVAIGGAFSGHTVLQANFDVPWSQRLNAPNAPPQPRSEEHTSELQSLMRI